VEKGDQPVESSVAFLPDTEETFRLATKAGKIGVWDWDIAADQILWSESLYTIYGVEVTGEKHTIEAFRSMVHPEDRAAVDAALRSALAHDTPSELEYRAVRPDGAVIWLFITARVVRDETGRPVRMVGSTMDITARKSVEIALRESEQRFFKAFNASPLCLTISSMVTGKLIEVNDAFLTLTGFSREEAIGKSTVELGVWARPEEREADLATIRAVGSLRNREYRFRRRDGGELIGLLSAEVIDVGGEPSILTVVHDITERKKYEEALRESDRRKDEFLATLAHELRNPLAPISNAIDLLEMGVDDPASNARILAVMKRQLRQMVRLVDDLLDVSRISRGKIELRTAPIALSAAIASAIETSQPLMDAAGHRLLVKDVPETVMVEADLTRLSQAIANLLNNAAKYSPNGSEIRLDVEPAADEVVIRVRDNGSGISEEVLPQVFDLFTRADTSLERPQSGLGIGLTIVKRLVEMHGGSIEAVSAGKDRGSEFVVRLPRLKDCPATEVADKGPAKPATSMRVLVVDDNRDSAETMAMLLASLGHETRIAYDGHEAIAAAEAFRPDMITLDIGMPVMNGYEACRRIRMMAWGREILIIAVTGWGQVQDRERSREAGFDGHLTKPMDISALQQLVASRSAQSAKGSQREENPAG
jgi:PAS domain S-box-containing protein